MCNREPAAFIRPSVFYVALIGLLFSLTANAAPPIVSTVPVLSEDPIQPHDIISGQNTTLKGAVDEASVGSTWTWNPGDGTPSVSGVVAAAATSIAQMDDAGFTPYYAIWIEHTYTGSDGEIFLATLTITNGAGESDSAVYRMRMRDKTLTIEVNTSIDESLWFMHRNQLRFIGNPVNGSTAGGTVPMARWDYVQTGGSVFAASVAATLNAFEANGYTETDSAASPYTETVQRGLRYLFSRLTTQTLVPQTFGRPVGFPDDPDSNGNGIGIIVNEGHQPYQLGMIIDAVVATGTPAAITTTGPANVTGRTYGDIVQDMVDWYAMAQSDSTAHGGWRYSAFSNTTGAHDNSTAGWAAIGMLAAEDVFGATVPDWVKTRNLVGLELTDVESNVANSDGQHGYTNSPNPAWGAASVTGAAFVQMAMDRLESTSGATPDERWIRTENWMRRNLGTAISGNNLRNYYYAMFNFAKALRSATPQEVVLIGTSVGASDGGVGCGPSAGCAANGAQSLDWYLDPVIGLARTVVDFQTQSGPNTGMFSDRPGNSQGSWQDEYNTPWATQILTRTLFQAGPVARAFATPNPGALNSPISFDASESFHQDPARSLVLYEWDFDNDGVFDQTGVTATRSFSDTLCPVIPCTLPVTLKVTDNNSPARFDTAIINVQITIPPHPPTANAGGSYLMCTAEEFTLDGSGSFDVDEGESESGQPPFDTITSYEWELDGVSPFDFAEASGDSPLVSFLVPGIRDIGLRVTDNTALAFPSAGQPDLTHSNFTTVTVADCSCIGPITARPKPGKAQLVWSPVSGAVSYDILQSLSPNRDFEIVAADHLTDYATYLQRGLTNGTTYWYRVVPKGADGMAICASSNAVSATPQTSRRPRPDLVQVPAVIGLSQSDAGNELAVAGLGTGDVAFENSDTAPEDTVISSDPATGTNVVAGSLVDLVVSLGPVRVPTPDVIGATQADAEAAIVAAGLSVGTVGTANSDTVAAGLVISQDPMGGILVVTASAVSFVVSLGPPTVAVPDIVGLTQANAEAALTGAGLAVGTIGSEFSAVVPVDLVISQALPAGSSQFLNTPVDFVVSLGPVTVAVPNVVNQAQADAEAAIVAATLTVGAITTQSSSTIAAGNVISQSPGAGSLELPGTPVDLVISLGPIQATVPDVVGLTQAAAVTALTTADLSTGTITTQNSLTIPAGEVISQDPAAGGVVNAGSPVNLVVSLGPVQATVPNVVGQTQAAAEAAIVAANLTVGVVSTAVSPTVPAGDVISQNPVVASVVDEQSPVDIVVSVGPVQVTVPNVVGLQQSAAEAAIVAANLTVGAISTQSSVSVPSGDVISQNPAGGATVAENSSVALVVSTGPVIVTVPDVVNLSQADAETAIVAASLTVGIVTTQNSATVPTGDVISQTPLAGTTAAENSAVNIVVSLGPVIVAVPDVIGLSQANAETSITGAGLVVGSIATQNDAAVPAGNVISQDPAAGGTLAEGSPVSIVVSLGPVLVIVPDVVGLVQASAEAAIVAANLTVGAVTAANSDTVPEGDIISQDPVAGASAAENSTVNIVVSLGTAVVPATVPDVVGLSQASASAAIVAANLIVGTITTQNDATVPAGDVISQNPPAGSSVAENSPVDMVISLGPVIVTVPDVVGLAQVNAEAAILGASLAVGVITSANSDTVPEGDVISQSPVAGASVAESSPVNIVVSLGVAIPDDVNPILNASLDQDPPLYLQGNSVLLNVVATDDSGTVTVTGTLDGAPIAITLPVTSINTSGMPIGSNHEIIVTATDAAANSVSQTLNFTIRDPADTTFPTVSFSSPAADSELMSPTNMVGTATDASLANYQLQLAPVGSGQFTTFFTGFTSVIADVLGLLDTTVVANGLYDLRLVAIDSNGNSASIQQPVIVSGQNKPGAFRIEFVDLNVPLSGIPIQVKRIYDSRTRTNSDDFGFGWNLEVIKAGAYKSNRKPGDGWIFNSGGGFFNFPCEGGAAPTKTHITEVRFTDTDFYRFELTVGLDGAITGGCAGVANFNQIGGVPGATLTILDGNSVFWQNGFDNLTFGLGDSRFGLVYEPERVRLTTIDGRQFDLDISDGLTRIGDLNGNSIFLSSSGVTHSSGKGITFTRDGAGRITTITDPMGNSLNYTYDAQGDLIAAQDRVGNTTTFGYNFSHFLLDITDPLGNIPLRYEYDAAGRVIAQIGPDGSRVEISTDLATNTTQVTDRIGTVITFTYDDEGYISNSSGGGASFDFTYDARGNKLTQTDALGNTESYSYDANDNLLSEMDPLGNMTSYTYGAGGRPASVTDPAGNIMAFVHDGSGNPAQVTDGDGTVVQAFTYDGSGNPTQVTTLGGVNNFSFDSFGNMVGQTGPGGLNYTFTYDASGNVSSQSSTRTTSGGPVTDTRTYTYDANSRPLTVTDSLGNVTTTVWNSVGQVESRTDALGRTTSLEYDIRGNVFRKTFADGTQEVFGYDGKNRKTAETDQAGRTKFFEYDLRGNLIQILFPDGGSINSTYDVVNNLITTTNQLGETTTYAYDANHRRTQMTDALGNITIIAYNAMGAMTTSTDPLGRVTSFAYDESTFGAPRIALTTFPDGASQAQSYSESGRIASTTDESGNVTSFTYDGVGNLLTVTDSLGNVTSHIYDEAGNRIFTTDANGNVTSMDYDANRQLLSRINPLGNTESFTYDAASNVVSHTNFNGDTTTFVYDAVNRLTQRNQPGGVTVDYSYSDTDMIETITDSRGATSYTYDNMDRVTQITQPDGTPLNYTYDVANNRTTIGGPAGVTSYSYDPLNRLSQVTDPEAGITINAYDGAGQLTSISYPNGTIAQFSYDSRSRATTVQHVSGASTLGQYNYIFDPVGNRTQMSESSGRVVDYSYDARRMLTQESDDISGATIVTSYTYDPVGNRLSMDEGGVITSYTYDAGDRLLTAGAAGYTYDNNGNRLTQTVGIDVTNYTYDTDNRLVRHVAPGGITTNYLYDDFGSRVQSETGGTITNYVVDSEDLSGVSQVVAEQDGLGVLQRGFVYGNGLIRQRQGGTSWYYHFDGLGSTRLLSDSAGAVSDSYDYSAYGSLAASTGGTLNNYRFAGEQLDQNAGLYYLRARYMDPATGRFIGQDPLQGNANDPLSLHRYLYAGNNPVNMVDPTGEFASLGGMSVSLGIVSTLATIAISTYAIYTDVTDVLDKLEELVSKIPALKLNEELTADELRVRIVEIQVGLGGIEINLDAHLGGGAVAKAYDVSTELVGGTAGEVLAFIYAYSAGQWMAQLPAPEGSNKPGNYLSCGFNNYLFGTYQLQLLNGNISGTVLKPAMMVIGAWLNYFNLVALIGSTASDFSVPPQPATGACPLPLP